MKTSLRRIARLSSPALALACGAASAQSADTLAPVVVTATRMAVPLRDVLADVTVIGRDELDRHGGRALGDVLSGVPGFQMARNGGPAGTTSLFVRGGDQRFTAVLVDGVRVDTQTTGGATWEAIPLSQIERIEVLRGPASAVYGSDAMSGVVQIFTRMGEPGLRLDAGVGGGSFGTVRSDAALSGMVGPVDFAVSSHKDTSDGYNARTTGDPDRDGHRAGGASGRLGWNIATGHRVEMSALRSHVDGEYDPRTNPATHTDDHSVHDLETVRALWTARLTDAWTSSLSAAQAKDFYETRPSFYETKTRVRTAMWQNDLRLGAHTVNATLERREDSLVNSGLDGSASRERDQDAVAVGYGWRTGRWAVQANARHDRNDAFGSVNTGSLAAGVEVAPGWRISSSVGNGFRAPTLYQQYAAEFGNATLKPERSLSNVDVALRRQAAAFEASLTLYRNRVADLISFGGPDPTLCAYESGCYDNVDGVSKLQGATLASSWAGDGLRVAASVDFLSARRSDGRDLARRSRRHAALKVDKELGDTTVGVEWLAHSKRYDRDPSPLVLGGYSVVNLDVTHRFNAQWRVIARVDNFFDKEYQTAATYAAAPQAVFVGLRWTPTL